MTTIVNARPTQGTQEQRAAGLLPVTKNFVAPTPTAHEITPAELATMQQGGALAGQVMSYQPSQHARSDDNALTLAKASLMYSVAYAVALAVITAGVLLVAWLAMGGDGGRYVVAWLVLWGVSCLIALAYNRWQGLHFSPVGLGHHEIDSRERIAMHAIDRHVELIERRWDRDR